MIINNLKFFTGCAASLTLLCSFALFGCSGAENDISALECFAGSCDEDDSEKGHNDEHHDPDYADPNNIWTADPGDCDEHGYHEDFDCNTTTIGTTLFDEAYHVIFVCEEYAGWIAHDELSYCSDYSGNGGSQSKKSSNPLCGDLWCGPDHNETVTTGFDDGSNTSGIWSTFDDNEAGGSSFIRYKNDAESCSGLCGTVSLNDSLYSQPYAGLYFNLVNEKSAGADISSWKGFCITYQIPELGPTIELVHQRGDEVAPFVTYLDPTKTSANISWNDFIQQQTGTQTSLGRDTFLSRVAAIKIFWIAPTTQSVTFKITSIGTYDSCP